MDFTKGATLFRGVAELNLDSKGRIAVPTRYREQLNGRCGGQLVITIDTAESCLAIYPLPEWEELQPKLDRLSSINPMTARVKRQLMGNATDVDMDANGRLLIPTKLRKHANLDKKVVLIGQGKKFEIWDEATWDARNERWQEEAVLDSINLPPELGTLDL
jgi:MraZ protein